MPMIGTIGRPVIVNNNHEFAIKNVALIKFNQSIVLNIFVKELLDSHYFDYLIEDSTRGGTQKFISLKNIRNFSIPTPPIELQNQFADIVQQINSLDLSALETQATTLKAALSQELLS